MSNNYLKYVTSFGNFKPTDFFFSILFLFFFRSLFFSYSYPFQMHLIRILSFVGGVAAKLIRDTLKLIFLRRVFYNVV